jgi:hypothetical protein
MPDTGPELPRAQAHKNHGSLIAKTSFGSEETKFDANGNRTEGIITIEGVKGRRHMFNDPPAGGGGAY